jgi:hypothetical protein
MAEFRSPDFDFIKSALRTPVIFDGRNLYDPANGAGRLQLLCDRPRQAVHQGSRERPAPVIPVILSGGAGTRLWPLSREMYPKQLLALTSKHTMLQDTALRLAGIAGRPPPIVVCNEAHRFTVAEQLRALGGRAAAILLEPAGRNTAPAVALAALKAQEWTRGHPRGGAGRSCDPRCRAAFSRRPTWRRDWRRRQAGHLRHRRACAGDRLRLHPPRRGRGPAYPVAQFIEKPPLDVAVQFVASGDYYWNSGMFVFKAGALSGGAGAPSRRTFSRPRGGLQGGQGGPGFRAHRQDRLREMPQRVDRLRGHGEDQDAVVLPLMRAGAMSVPGPRCSTRCRPTRTAMCCRAMCWCTTRTIATCTRPAAW